MNKNINTLFFLLLVPILIGCSSNSNKNDTYFGGKIVNPKTKYVTLYSMNNVIDTLLLDSKNKFLGKFSSFKEGLYYFKHGNENQYIYLEPKDSLMLRLNTWDFDESLVFAGKGAERNNILIDIFIENEKQNAAFFRLNSLDPEIYQQKMDSIIRVRKTTFNDYLERHPNETSNYFNVLKTALNFPIYSRIERYPINHSMLKKEENFVTTNNSFYNYRNSINYNNDSLLYYSPYTRYIRNYLYNLTYSMGHKPTKNEFSEEFTVDLLKNIDKKINLENSKNIFLKRTVLDHFHRKSSCNLNKSTFNTFLDLSTNKEDKILINNILNDNKAIKKGDEIKDFNIFDFTDKQLNIQDFVLNRNSVLLFWNEEYLSKDFLSTRVSYLANKFPNLNFAVIEINGNSSNKIPKIGIKNLYYIKTKSLESNFLQSGMPRTILVNKNGIVENGYASIASQNFYKQLELFSKNN